MATPGERRRAPASPAGDDSDTPPQGTPAASTAGDGNGGAQREAAARARARAAANRRAAASAAGAASTAGEPGGPETKAIDMRAVGIPGRAPTTRTEGPDDDRAAPPKTPKPPKASKPESRRAEERHTLRYRVLPRSLIGIAALILSFALGAGFSGVVLYSYYQFHLDQTNDRVNTLIGGYKKQFADAGGLLTAQANAAKAQIAQQLAPLQQLQADPKVLANLVKTLAPSVYFVHTQDTAGQPSVGTAFVIASNTTQSLLLTSATTVSASQAQPAPAVYLSKDNQDTKVTVRSIDTQYDLALIVLPQGNLPVIKVASSPTPQPGDKLYAMSGLGSAGASVSEGTITDVSASGVATNTPIGSAFQGGPLVNSTGQVVAIASLGYSPNGFASAGVTYAPYPQSACSKVLSCPSGSIPTS